MGIILFTVLSYVFFFNISNSSSINLLHAASIGIIFLGNLPLYLSSLIHCSKSAFHLDFSPELLSSVFNVSQIHSTWLGFHYLNTASLTLNSLPPPPPQEHLLLSQVINHSKTVLVVVHTQYLTSSTHYLTSSLSKTAESSVSLTFVCSFPFPFHNPQNRHLSTSFLNYSGSLRPYNTTSIQSPFLIHPVHHHHINLVYVCKYTFLESYSILLFTEHMWNR